MDNSLNPLAQPAPTGAALTANSRWSIRVFNDRVSSLFKYLNLNYQLKQGGG